MAKYWIDTEAFVKRMESEKKCANDFEVASVGMNDYENAIKCREQGNIYGNLIMNATETRLFAPETVEDGGFVRKLTKIREAINSMTDEELTEVLYRTHTLKDGKLVARYKLDCVGKCPNFVDPTGENTDLIEVIMMQEA